MGCWITFVSGIVKAVNEVTPSPLALFCFVQQFFFLQLRADQSDPVPETGGLIRTVPESDGIISGFQMIPPA